MAQPMTGRQRYRWGLLLLAAALLVVWLFVDGSAQDGTDESTSGGAGTSSVQTTDPAPTDSGTTEDTGGDGGTDPESGLPVVQVADLPPEAAEVLDLIDAGGPFPEPEHDGGVFENREDLLPDHPLGYYKEYTVPTPGSDGRGARRIVAGRGGERYYTGDHYRSFSRIAR